MDMADDETGPILVRRAEDDDGESISSQGVRVDIISHVRHRGSLSVSIPEELLARVSDTTTELRGKLDRFVNALNSKLQSVCRVCQSH
jgi:hypothetical protein